MKTKEKGCVLKVFSTDVEPLGYLDCGMGGIRDPRLVQNIADATFVAKKPSCKVLRAAAGLVHDIGLKGFHIKAVPVEQRWVEAS